MIENFVFRKEWRDALKGCDIEVRAEVYEAIMAYAFDDEVLDMSALAQMAFNFIKPQIDAMREAYVAKCQRNKDNANRRWRGDATESEDIPEDANGCDGVRNDATAYDRTPNDATECEGVPLDAYNKIQQNKIQQNKIQQESVCVKSAHTRTREPTPIEKSFIEFIDWCQKHAPLALAFKEPLQLNHFEWLITKYGGSRMRNCASDLHNKEAYKSNRNAMNVWKKWIERVA